MKCHTIIEKTDKLQLIKCIIKQLLFIFNKWQYHLGVIIAVINEMFQEEAFQNSVEKVGVFLVNKTEQIHNEKQQIDYLIVQWR